MRRSDDAAAAHPSRDRKPLGGIRQLAARAGSLLSGPRHETKSMSSTFSTSTSSRAHARARLEFDGTVEFTHADVVSVRRYGTADAAREAVLDDVTAIAKKLELPVRLSTEGARGYLELWVHPDGSVEQIPESIPPRVERPEAATPAFVPAPAPAATLPIRPEPERPVVPTLPAAAVLPPAEVSAAAAGIVGTPTGAVLPLPDERSDFGSNPEPDSEQPDIIRHVPFTWSPGPGDPDASESPVEQTLRFDTITAVPVLPAAIPELPEEVERTVLMRRDRRTPATRPDFIVTLHTSTGRTLELRGTGVLGRAAATSESVVLDDPEGTVSGSHLGFEVEEAGLRVTDLDSSNGTTITSDGLTTVCRPGSDQLAARGARIDLGSMFVVVV